MGVLPPVTTGLWGYWDATQLTGYANGASVSTLPDLSGNGHDFTTSGSNTAPTYNTSLTGLNFGLAATTGMSAVASGFSGNFSFSLGLINNSGDYSTETYCGFFCAATAGASDYNSAGGFASSVGDGSVLTNFTFTWVNSSSNGFSISSGKTVLTVPKCYGFSAASSTGYMWEGTQKNQYESVTASFAPTLLALGQRIASGAIGTSSAGVFTFGSLALYNTTLTDNQMAQLQNFTAQRIGAPYVAAGGGGVPRIVVPRRIW